MKQQRILTRERTETERQRRHLYGDSGAKFSKGKCLCLKKDNAAGTITTFVTKEMLVLVIEDEDH
ncbi:MAG: hypothetical protein HUK06_01690 [Bacteroidaceae bacterium]|nr:hypothetical protein [Bacteroidaceae bacterium]